MFPDGQLYVNLRGYDPSDAPMAPAEAVRGFLDGLGVPTAQIPADSRAQAGLYRSLLARKRVLIVLDNARDSAQIRPLLPGAAGCLVLATSRSRLTGLAAANGARLLILDVLTDGEARTLLSRRLSAESITAEPGAADELITLCARLPLALNIVAARAAARPAHPLSALAATLRGERARLDAFDTGEPASSARTVFSCSYGGLSGPAARMFRLLGLHPGPDITVAAAASLAGIQAGQADRAIGELTSAYLLAEHLPGRFSCHDLLRAYAAEQAAVRDTVTERCAATSRMLDHYLHTARSAAVFFCPGRDLLLLGPVQAGVVPERHADTRAALAWFSAERHVVSSAVRRAADVGLDTRAWQLGWVLGRYLHRCGYWQEWIATLHMALAAAKRAADVIGQAFVYRDLGLAQVCLGTGHGATAYLGRALARFEQLGDEAGQAHTLLCIGGLEEQQARPREALGRALQALTLFRAAGHKAGQANAISNAGLYHSYLGEYELALSCCHEALALHGEVGNRDGEGCTWDTLGQIYHLIGQDAQAITCFRHGVRLFRELGDRPNLAIVLTRLGDLLFAEGKSREARSAWQEALVILDDLHDPSAPQILAKLSQ